MLGRKAVDQRGNAIEYTNKDYETAKEWLQLAKYQRAVGISYDQLMGEPKFWVEFQNYVDIFKDG